MQKRFVAFLLAFVMVFTMPIAVSANDNGPDLSFDIVIDVLEWSSAVTAVVIDMGEVITAEDLAGMDIYVSAVIINPVTDAVVYDGERIIRGAYLSTTGIVEHSLIRNAANPSGTGSVATEGAESGRFVVVELTYGFGYVPSFAVLWQNGNRWGILEYSVTIDGNNAVQGDWIRPIYDDFAEVANPVAGYTTQRYRMYSPAGTGPFPLVLWNHGGGETYNAAVGLNEGAQLFANMGGVGWVLNAPEPAFVLAPQRGATMPGGYSRSGVVAFINNMIDQGLVDANRVYLVGPSAGGMETHAFMNEFPEMWAAAIPICPGTLSVEGAVASAHFDFPIWYVVDINDPVTPASNVFTSMERLLAAGTDASRITYTITDGVYGLDGVTLYDTHWTWIPVLNNDVVENGVAIIDWLFAQTRALTPGYIVSYRAVVEGFDWGPGVTRLIVRLSDAVEPGAINAADFDVVVTRQPGFQFSPDPDADLVEVVRTVTNAFVSDHQGNPATGARSIVTLELATNPDVGNPFTFILSPMGNDWADPHAHTITWNDTDFDPAFGGRFMPLGGLFNITGQFTGSDGQDLQYAFFNPPGANADNQRPLIVWLHGAGEGSIGGTVTPEAVIFGNRVTQLVAPEIQGIMGGAFVLTPQAPTVWLMGTDAWAGEGEGYTSNYEVAMIELIRDFVERTPGVDPTRVYVGGCSNGGYAVFRAMFLAPELFAAAFPICPVYNEDWYSDEKFATIAHIPTWLVHDINDPTVTYDHATRFYDAMRAAGATNIHITLTDGLYSDEFFDAEGNPHRFNDHWSWIPVLNNDVFNAQGQSIFEWMAAQSLSAVAPAPVATGEPADLSFDIVIDVLEWGSAVTAIVIDMGEVITAADLAGMDIEISAVVTSPLDGSVVQFDGERTIRGTQLLGTNNIEHTLIRNPVRPGGMGTVARADVASGRFVIVELTYGWNYGGSQAVTWGYGNRWSVLDYSVTVNGIEAAQGGLIRPIYDDFAEVTNPVAPYNTQRYRMFTPAGSGPFPLVLWNHGGGEVYNGVRGQNEGAQLFANMGGIGWVLNAPEAAVVLAPQRQGGGPGGTPAEALLPGGYSREGVIAYINHLVSIGLVDPARIYVSGPSAGGTESRNFLIEFPDVFAAAVIICTGALTPEDAPAVAHIPIWLQQSAEFEAGEVDGSPFGGHLHGPNTMSYAYVALVELGANVRHTIYNRSFGTELPNQWSPAMGAPEELGGFDYRFYIQHWSWIMVLNNVAVRNHLDDGFGLEYYTDGIMGERFMDWMFAQILGEVAPVPVPLPIEVPEPIIAPAPAGSGTVVNAWMLNVRSSASAATDDNIIGALNRGDVVIILESTNVGVTYPWHRIQFGDLTGWVFGRYLELN